MRQISVHQLLLLFVLLFANYGCGSGDAATGPANESDQPIDKLNQQIEATPNDASAYFNRGQHYYEGGIYGEAARDLIRCTELDSSRMDCWHLLADAYLDDSRSRPAIETLEDYLKLHPKDIPTLLKIATFQTIIKKYTAARYHLNNILQQDKTHAQALFKKGLIYHYEGKALQAVEYLQQAIQSDPDLVDGHLLLGQLFEEAGNPMAQRYFENAIRVGPDKAEPKMALANYFWMRDDYASALKNYENLLQIHPEFAKGYFNRGLIYLELDSLSAAQQSMEEAIKYDPDFAQAHYYLGETFDLKGKWALAKAALEEAARLTPTDPKIVKKTQEIEDKIRKANK